MPSQPVPVESGPAPGGRPRSLVQPQQIPPWLNRAWSALHLDFTGVGFAALFFAWSVTPSLLPRDWLFQGLVSGISSAAGYGVGTAFAWLFRRYVPPRYSGWRPSHTALIAVKALVVIAAAVTGVVMLSLAAGWQRELAEAMGMAPTTTSAYVRTGGLSLVVATAVVAVSRVLRYWGHWIADKLNRWVRIPPAVATVLGGVLVGVLIVTLVSGVLMRALFAVSNVAFSLRNEADKPGVIRPLAPERSGSTASLVAWETLGRQGRAFTARGLSAAGLERMTGDEALEPIRIYAGVDSTETSEAQADLTVAELERTDAFDREVLVVVTTTGTGWVNETAAQAIELMYRGDTAIVATQYSFLPSALSFLGDREKAAQAGDLLFERVHEAWTEQAPDSRPQLVVYGESLGAMGSEMAFDGLADIRSNVDGALWVGPPHFNRLASQLIQRRDPGSLALVPRYADGLIVRFAGSKQDLVRTDDGSWLGPRILYLRLPTDPVVWWTPDLVFDQPDWLAEARDPELFPHMRWWPIVTFAQLTADMVNASSAPEGFGHNYGTLVLDAWVAIVAPPEWTDADTETTREILRRVTPAETARP